MQRQKKKFVREDNSGGLTDQAKAFYKNISNFLLEETDDANKGDYLCSIFDKLCEEAVPVAQSQTCSRTVEGLLPMADSQQLCRLLGALAQNWPAVTTGRFAGHVLQTLLTLLPQCFQEDGAVLEEGDADAEAGAASLAATTWKHLEALCRHFASDVSALALQTYSSHVLRALLELLAGTAVSERLVRSRASRTNKTEKLPHLQLPEESPWRSCMWKWFKKLAKKIFKTCDYDDHLVDQNFNPVLQTVLLVLQQRDPDLLHKYCHRLLKHIHQSQSQESEEEREELPSLVQDKVGSYLAELLVHLSLSPETAAERDAILFNGRLLQYAIHPIANFVLNSHLAQVSDLEQAKEALKELLPDLETILAVNAVQVVIAISDICRRMKTSQKRFLKKLMAAFHCLEPADRQGKIVPLLATMSTYEVLFEAPAAEGKSDAKKPEKSGKTPEAVLTHVTMPGSLLLQSLLGFEEPAAVSAGLASLAAPDLRLLAMDPAGSHVLDAFLQSPTVSTACHLQVASTLKGAYADLACSKHGSFTLEALWTCAPIQLRKDIAFELSKEQARLQSNGSGYIVYKKLALEKFIHNQKAWTQMQQSALQKRKFSPAPSDVSGKSKRRKRNAVGHN